MNYEISSDNDYKLEKSYKLDAEIIARPISDQILYNVCNTYSKRPPHLIGILAESESDSESNSYKYAKWTEKTCKKNQIKFELIIVPKILVESYIRWANNEVKIDGIIIYYPIYHNELHSNGTKMDDYLKNLVNYKKDVEGLSLYHHNILYNSDNRIDKKKCIIPCTAKAVIKCLEYLNQFNNKLLNKTITVINRSSIVGKPISQLLCNEGAKVYSVDIDSIILMELDSTNPTISNITMEEACQISDIIILGVPDPTFKLDTKHVKKNTIVINVSSNDNIDEEQLLKIEGVKYINSIGKITIAMLQINLINLCDQFR